MSGMNHNANQMLESVSGRYSSGSAQRIMHHSNGAGSQSSVNLRSSSLSSGSQSIPEIEYLEEEISEADNSNTVFIQNRGSAGSNVIQNQGSSGSYAIQNQGRSGGFGIQDHRSSGKSNFGSFGIQNHGSVGILNHGSSSSGISGVSYQSVVSY